MYAIGAFIAVVYVVVLEDVFDEVAAICPHSRCALLLRAVATSGALECV